MRPFERLWFNYFRSRPPRTRRAHPLEAWYLWVIHATAHGIAWGITQHQRLFKPNTTQSPAGDFFNAEKEKP